jgi:uncharacterized membrane protein (UPF0127 family)
MTEAGSRRAPGAEPPRARRSTRLPSPRALQWLVVVLLVAGGVSFITKGANRPPDPYLVATRDPIPGFGEIAYRVQGRPGQRCALLADTPEQHSQGLMGRHDLAGHDGMIFRFHDVNNAAFWMKDTPMPLSIAWFDAAGRFVSSADMEPCLDQAGSQCPVYPAAGPYSYALEVQKGGLGPLGVGPGSQISLGGSC